MTKKQKKNLKRIIIASVGLIAVNLLTRFVFIGGNALNSYFYGIPVLLVYAALYLVIGGDVLLKAGRGIFNRQIFDENFLMAVATLGVFVLALFEKSGDYNEAIAVMLFYQIGELFQSIAVGKSRRSIAALMDIRPDYANIEKDGQLVKVSPDEVAAGSVIVVQPGEKVPIDGTVVEGSSSIDTSAITGESALRDVSAGDTIVSGCINCSGVLKIKTEKEFKDSTVSKILALVETSTSHKSKSENFISKFARVYTPAVCTGALLLCLLPPCFNLLVMKAEPLWSTWLYRALTFLVISCPCALVISIPLTFFVGIGGASREGILVKGSNYLETLSKIDTVVFDKTGTLTKGVFEVSAIHHSSMPDEKLVELAAHAECYSSHPVSLSLRKAYGQNTDCSRVSDVQEISGYGVIAKVDGIEVAVGNSRLMEKLNLHSEECHCHGTIIHVSINGEYSGHIVISDVIRPESKPAIEELKKAGITKTVMLTGDSAKAAETVAAELGIDSVFSGLLPADKVLKVEEMLDSAAASGKAPGRKGKLAFIGDGINDAPVLSRADVGIAMGAIGSDAAIEAADVVIMDDNPLKISKAIKISRKCLRIVVQNIYFALGIKFGCLLIGALGLAGMWSAIFADVGVMVIAVLNAIRALEVKKI